MAFVSLLSRRNKISEERRERFHDELFPVPSGLQVETEAFNVSFMFMKSMFGAVEARAATRAPNALRLDGEFKSRFLRLVGMQTATMMNRLR